MKAEAKQFARNLLGQLRSEASRYKAENPAIDEEEYFKQISRDFLHSFALEVTTIIGLPTGLDVFWNTRIKNSIKELRKVD